MSVPDEGGEGGVRQSLGLDDHDTPLLPTLGHDDVLADCNLMTCAHPSPIPQSLKFRTQ
jgi:hypothetical protein